MVTIAIPSFNKARYLAQAIESAVVQDYKDKEILVIDDCSTDGAAEIARKHKMVTVKKNDKNLGFALNMQRLTDEAKGKYIVFLCDDDMFANPFVVSDIVKIFETFPKVGVVDRDYFQFLDKTKQVVAVSREDNVLISCVNPSGMGFRKSMMTPFSDKIYAETAHVVKTMNCLVKKLSYDSIAVRLHEHNQALDKKYYRHSILKNWEELLGNNSKVIWDFRANFICMKNRAGMKYLLSEIRENVRIQPKVLLSPSFWLFFILAVLTPAPVLKWMGNIYRKSRNVKPRKREHGPVILNLGAGRKLRNDACNVDALPYPGIDTVADLGKYPWKWNGCSVDGIYASHIIEHFPDQEKFIRECHRILKPGGFLRFNLPHSSSVTSIGCMGHYRTYSYSTCRQYLSEDYYMFGKPLFKTVEQKLLWWYEECDAQGELTSRMRKMLMAVAPLMNWLARLNPHVCENWWCFLVGGMREVVWKGIKL